MGWSPDIARVMAIGHDDLYSIIGQAAFDAMPRLEKPDAFALVYLIQLALLGVEWLGFPISFALALPAHLAAMDLLVDMSIRLLAIAVAGYVAADMVFRHVVGRAPYRRKARWVDGPQVYWFKDATSAASSHLRKLVADAGRGVNLAPRLTLPRKAEHESMFGLAFRVRVRA